MLLCVGRLLWLQLSVIADEFLAAIVCPIALRVRLHAWKVRGGNTSVLASNEARSWCVQSDVNAWRICTPHRSPRFWKRGFRRLTPQHQRTGVARRI